MELNIAGAQRCMSRIMGVVLVFPYYCFACVRICGKNFDCSSSCTKWIMGGVLVFPYYCFACVRICGKFFDCSSSFTKWMIIFSFKIMRTFSCFLMWLCWDCLQTFACYLSWMVDSYPLSFSMIVMVYLWARLSALNAVCPTKLHCAFVSCI